MDRVSSILSTFGPALARSLALVLLLGTSALCWAAWIYVNHPVSAETRARSRYWYLVAYSVIYNERVVALQLQSVDRPSRAALASRSEYDALEARYAEEVVATSPIPPGFSRVREDLLRAARQERIWADNATELVDYCRVYTNSLDGTRKRTTVSCLKPSEPNRAADAIALNQRWYRQAQVDAMRADPYLTTETHIDLVGDCWMPGFARWLRARGAAFDALASSADDEYSLAQSHPNGNVLPCALTI